VADLTLFRQSPLEHRALPARTQASLGEARFGLNELRFRGVVNLRIRRDDPAARQAVEAALGLTLPAVGKASAMTEATLYGVGPDEWLAVGSDGPALAERLRAAAAGQFVGVTDVTENYTTLVASGPAAREILAKGCPLDLHTRAFQPGDVAGSVIAKATVVLHLVREEAGDARFEILVRRSFADYLFRWLEDAGRDVGVVVRR
jgi:sarcosine oxidase subunit gamma